MNEIINKYMNEITPEEASLFDESLEGVVTTSEISSEQQARIHAAVMRKAGFEMKEIISVKRTKKRTLAIVVIAAAIACLCGFTAYSGIKYFYGNAFKYRITNNGKEITGDIRNLESTTQPFNGVVLENTFKDIDITVEGIVSDTGRDCALLTARKTDGTPFAENDEKLFAAGLQMDIPCDMECFEGKEINDASELYWGGDSVHCELNDDGSLSITIDNTWKMGDEEYDYIFGFGDIFSYRNIEEIDDEYTNYLNSFSDLDNFGVFLGITSIEDYNKKLEAHKLTYRSFSDDLYEGTFIIKAHITDKTLTISPDENDYGMKIMLSGVTCTMIGDGKRFLELAETEPDGEGDGIVDVTFKTDNGEEFTEKFSFSIYSDYEPGSDSSEVVLSSGFSQFTDPYKVTEILINGNTLWKK
jgi:hypothetical protein